MKPIICIAPAPAVEPHFFNDGWMVNKKYFLGVTAGGGVPVMATDIELADEYARLCDGLILTGSAMYVPSPEYAEQAKAIEKQSVIRWTKSCSMPFRRPVNLYLVSAADSRISTYF